MNVRHTAIFLAATLTLALSTYAQAPVAQPPKVDPTVQMLLERIERLEAEVARLKAESVPPATSASAAGVDAGVEAAESTAPAPDHGGGSWADNLAFHGYGEVHYNDPRGGGDTFDVHRLVLGFSYRLNDQFSAEAELDFEHSFSEPELEFAHVTWQPRPDLAARFGALLMPVGMLNRTHEPPLFYSVERPYTQKLLIPTTWQETGASLEWSRGGYRLTAAVTSALDPTRASAGKLATEGIRSMRSKAVEASGEDLALTFDQEYRWMSGGRVGLSLHHSQLDHGVEELQGTDITLAALYGQWAARGWDLRGEYVWTRIGDAERINDYLGASPSKGLASRMRGGYAEAGFDWLSLGSGRARLVQFLRYESLDTQASMPDGTSANPAGDRTLWTTGLAYYPPGLDNLAFKADYERWKDGSGKRASTLNLGVGWMF